MFMRRHEVDITITFYFRVRVYDTPKGLFPANQQHT